MSYGPRSQRFESLTPDRRDDDYYNRRFYDNRRKREYSRSRERPSARYRFYSPVKSQDSNTYYTKYESSPRYYNDYSYQRDSRVDSHSHYYQNDKYPYREEHYSRSRHDSCTKSRRDKYERNEIKSVPSNYYRRDRSNSESKYRKYDKSNQTHNRSNSPEYLHDSRRASERRRYRDGRSPLRDESHDQKYRQKTRDRKYETQSPSRFHKHSPSRHRNRSPYEHVDKNQNSRRTAGKHLNFLHARQNSAMPSMITKALVKFHTTRLQLLS